MRYPTDKMTEYMRQYRAARKAEAHARLGGKCVTCGSIDNLQFDHIDPATKVLSIGKMWHASKAAFWAEVMKCQLLCWGCHQVKSSAAWAATPTRHGSHHGYATRACRCDPCKEWNAIDRRTRRVASMGISALEKRARVT